MKAYHTLNCKESILSRGFSQASFKISSGLLTIDFKDGEPPLENVLGKTRVKFWDTKNEIMVFGAIEIALANGFPVAKDSIKKLRSRQLVRIIAD